MEKEQQSKNWGVFYERKGKNKSGIGGSRRILSATLEALSGKKGGYDSGRHGGQRCGPAGFGDTEKACCASDRYPIGERDGLWVLENIKKRGLPCICIFISAIDSDKLVRQAISLGAEYYMAKPIQGELLLERIHQMLKQETPTKEAAKPKAAERRENPFEELESEISILLSRMGISASIKGYHFIRKAVMMAVENQDVLVGITKGLYPDIAKQYKTTASKVERAIRHAIESVWKKNGPQVYFEVAGYLPTEKPTNGQFIAALSEYFRIKEKGKSKKIS